MIKAISWTFIVLGALATLADAANDRDFCTNQVYVLLMFFSGCALGNLLTRHAGAGRKVLTAELGEGD